MRSAKLTYFRGRGRAETTRWMLAATGTEFENIAIDTPEQLAALRASGKLPFDQMPLLEHGLLRKIIAIGCAIRVEVDVATRCHRDVARLKREPLSSLDQNLLVINRITEHAARDANFSGRQMPFTAHGTCRDGLCGI